MLLTLGGTAAGLVPPYLTWPLVDKVLEPYQDHVKELRSAAATERPRGLRSIEQRASSPASAASAST